MECSRFVSNHCVARGSPNLMKLFNHHTPLLLLFGCTIALAGCSPSSRHVDHTPSAPSLVVHTPSTELAKDTLVESAPRALNTPDANAIDPAKQISQPDSQPLLENMVQIPEGWFTMGQEEFSDALPKRRIWVDCFWMDATEVTNEQFARFVDQTGYVTLAERPIDPVQFPNLKASQLEPGSIVFTPSEGPVSLDNHTQWWQWVKGASWKHPEGPKSSIEGRERHPVLQVAWADAVAYATWAGKLLPTEAQWERAARGGFDQKEFCWGDDKPGTPRWQANIWQGSFPDSNSRADGYVAAAPVGSFPSNAYGLFDMSGNVWEWCADWYRPDAYFLKELRNPKGPDSSHDPAEPGTPKRVQRGGSYLCSDVYCRRYVPGGRGKQDVESATNHVGFRCVVLIETKHANQ